MRTRTVNFGILLQEQQGETKYKHMRLIFISNSIAVILTIEKRLKFLVRRNTRKSSFPIEYLRENEQFCETVRACLSVTQCF